jgi:hypothetical protein
MDRQSAYIRSCTAALHLEGLDHMIRLLGTVTFYLLVNGALVALGYLLF